MAKLDLLNTTRIDLMAKFLVIDMNYNRDVHSIYTAKQSKEQKKEALINYSKNVIKDNFIYHSDNQFEVASLSLALHFMNEDNVFDNVLYSKA